MCIESSHEMSSVSILNGPARSNNRLGPAAQTGNHQPALFISVGNVAIQAAASRQRYQCRQGGQFQQLVLVDRLIPEHQPPQFSVDRICQKMTGNVQSSRRGLPRSSFKTSLHICPGGRFVEQTVFLTEMGDKCLDFFFHEGKIMVSAPEMGNPTQKPGMGVRNRRFALPL